MVKAVIFDLYGTLARTILGIVGLNPEDVQFVHVPVHPKDIQRRAADYSKTKSILGWEPLVALEDGLQRTYEWFRTKA